MGYGNGILGLLRRSRPEYEFRDLQINFRTCVRMSCRDTWVGILLAGTSNDDIVSP